jgi:adenosylcobyric acid synthase
VKNKTEIKSPIMFVGTGSDVGKSVIAAGFCRILLEDGYRPAPFKSQNMSLNSFVTPDGAEIGRAQAVQAEACRLQCHVDMNPVLLKPCSDKTSQVIVNGKAIGNYSAGSYFNGALKTQLFQQAMAAYDRLAREHWPVVIEGAGSIAELNLKKTDIANMRLAVATNAATFLIADIERGGVFASVFGSIQLLEPEERVKIKGIIINKFRGDIALFQKGKSILEALTGVPVLGVIPAFYDICIEEEDSVALTQKARLAHRNKINIAVVLLRRMANFTDFQRLEQDDRVHLYYSNNKEELKKADIIIVPGSKNTVTDLVELHKNGIAAEIGRLARQGKSVIGICGGYQMMGREVADPHCVESDIEAVPGMHILPIVTTLNREKHTVQSSFYFKNKKQLCTGYEIHMGKTALIDDGKPLNKIPDMGSEGCIVADNIWGTYMHGILDNQVVIDDLLKSFTNKTNSCMDYDHFKQQQYDKLAKHIRSNIDMDLFYKIVSH